jgi:hypothetical protein
LRSVRRLSDPGSVEHRFVGCLFTTDSPTLFYFYFIMHQESESFIKTSIHWVTSFLLSYILRYVSFTEVDSVCRVVFREPMHLCTCVEGGDLGSMFVLETQKIMFRGKNPKPSLSFLEYTVYDTRVPVHNLICLHLPVRFKTCQITVSSKTDEKIII